MIKLKVCEDRVRLGVRESLKVYGSDASSVEIGTVVDGSPLSITNSGTPHNAVLDFVIPASIEHLSQGETVILYCGSATEVT